MSQITSINKYWACVLIWTTKAIQKPTAENVYGHALEKEHRNSSGYLGSQEAISRQGRFWKDKEKNRKQLSPKLTMTSLKCQLRLWCTKVTRLFQQRNTTQLVVMGPDLTLARPQFIGPRPGLSYWSGCKQSELWSTVAAAAATRSYSCNCLQPNRQLTWSELKEAGRRSGLNWLKREHVACSFFLFW